MNSETTVLHNEKSNFRQKILTVRNTITVEPLIAFYNMAICLSKPALDNLELEKACRVVLNYSENICDTILQGNHTYHESENDAIQVVISQMHSWQQPFQSFVPLLFCLFVGSFSDRYKLRKPLILAPIAGEILGHIGCIFCVVFLNLWSLNAQGILQKLLPSLFGGQVVMNLATTAYIADISTVEMRTLRLGVIQLVFSITSPLVNSFCGILFYKIGYYGILYISVIFLLISFYCGVFFVKEHRTECEHEGSKIVREILDIKYPLETFKMLYKKGPGVCRSHFLMITVVIFMHRSAFEGNFYKLI